VQGQVNRAEVEETTFAIKRELAAIRQHDMDTNHKLEEARERYVILISSKNNYILRDSVKGWIFFEGLNILISTFCVCADGLGLSKAFLYHLKL
jgi:hypothetical protein